MGQKVTDQVAEMRSLPAGIDQRSPARHPDWLGPDDLSLKVKELRELTKNKVSSAPSLEPEGASAIEPPGIPGSVTDVEGMM